MNTRRTRTAAKAADAPGRGRILRSPILWLTAGAALGAGLVILVLAIATGLPGGLGGLFGPASTIRPAPPTGPAPSVSIAPYIPASYTKPANLSFGRSLGSRDAPVSIDIWIDYQCPACRQFNQAMEPQLVTAYILPGKARFNVHDFAFLGVESVRAAVATRCADRQGQFWPYHELLFANQAPENSGALTEDRLLQFAAIAGLDLASYWACMQDQQVADEVDLETGEGSRKPVLETPWLLVNDVVIRPADWTNVSAAIDRALAGEVPQPSLSP